MESRTCSEQHNRITLADESVKDELKNWVNEMWGKNVFLSDCIIQEKACRLSYMGTNQGVSQQKYGNNFSNGLLCAFKKRNHFKYYKLHGEAIEAYFEAAERELYVLRSLLQQYGESNVFNADEFGLNYRRAQYDDWASSFEGQEAKQGPRNISRILQFRRHRTVTTISCELVCTPKMFSREVGERIWIQLLLGKEGVDDTLNFLSIVISSKALC